MWQLIQIQNEDPNQEHHHKLIRCFLDHFQVTHITFLRFSEPYKMSWITPFFTWVISNPHAKFHWNKCMTLWVLMVVRLRWSHEEHRGHFSCCTSRIMSCEGMWHQSCSDMSQLKSTTNYCFHSNRFILRGSVVKTYFFFFYFAPLDVLQVIFIIFIKILMLLLSKLKADQVKFTDYRYRYLHLLPNTTMRKTCLTLRAASKAPSLNSLTFNITQSHAQYKFKCHPFKLWVL